MSTPFFSSMARNKLRRAAYDFGELLWRFLARALLPSRYNASRLNRDCTNGTQSMDFIEYRLARIYLKIMLPARPFSMRNDKMNIDDKHIGRHFVILPRLNQRHHAYYVILSYQIA